MFVAAFREAGLPHGYSLFDAQGDSGFDGVLRELRDGHLAGLNVTAPFKKQAAERADERTPAVEETGAANVLWRDRGGRIFADNTDIVALAGELAEACPRARRAAILGAGGAALAAARACRDRGVGFVAVTTRSWVDSESLVDSPSSDLFRALGAIPCPWPLLDMGEPPSKASMVLRLRFRELAATADLIIQATSAGVAGGDSGEGVAACVPWDDAPPTAVALDLVYRPAMTPFLLEATSRNMPARNGVGMLIKQAEATYERWLGAPPPAGVMAAAAGGAGRG